MLKDLHMGIFCHGSHDAAAAVVDSEGRLLFAAEQERYDRIKHSSRFPRPVIEGAFRELGIGWGSFSSVSFAWSTASDFLRVGKFLAKNAVHVVPLLFRKKQNTPSRASKFFSMVRVKEELRELGWSGGLGHFHHHLCHAASAFHTSGFSRAACLSVDGNGEIASTTIHRVREGKFELLFQEDYPNSLGHFYAAFTQYLGFRPLKEEYKVMGLAAFGRELSELGSMREKVAQVLHVGGSGERPYVLRERYFQFQKGQDRMWSHALEELFGPPREPGSEMSERFKGIAAAVQERLEQAILSLSKRARELSGEENLCLAGGVALNCVANERLMRSGVWKQVYIPPFPHDSGSAVGAAYLARARRNGFSAFCLESAALGESLEERDCERAGDSGWKVFRGSREEICKRAAELLAQGKIAAWAHGRSEFGPRALGNRSILADPRALATKERLNAIIKRRELFRPFAPVVLEEKATEVFDMGFFPRAPFMVRTVPVRAQWRERIPAAMHVDGTARVQTLARKANQSLYSLLGAFFELTGVPVLLNTSLNVANEPIVNNADELLNLFRTTAIDFLVTDECLIEKS